MNYRERIYAALQGRPVDHLPWAPRWELFFNAAVLDGRLPDRWKGWNIFDVTRDLGMGIKGNVGTLYNIVMEGVDVRTRTDGIDEITEYDTPYGTLRAVFRMPAELQEEGVRGLEVEYPIKGADDYDAVYYMLDHTRVVPSFETWEAYEKAIGTDGLAYPQAGPCPLHKIQRVYTGYQQSYLELADNLPQVERLAEMLQVQFDQIADICAASPALAVEADGNYDISLHPPAFFDRWFLKSLQGFADKMHAAGKVFLTHVDGQTEGLLERVAAIGADIAEAWSPYPQTTITTADAVKVWQGRVGIWGGLPTPVLRESFPPDQFEAHFCQFLREIAPGTKVVVGTGDNFPTDSSWDRVRQATRLVEQYGKYPLDLSSLPY